MPPKVITVANQKGGTGKTTLTALLAYGLMLNGYKVLLLDLDPQSHLSSFFIKINEIERIEDGTLELAGGRHFKIREIDFDVESDGKVGLVPSGINYIIEMYRGKMPAWDPHAIYRRIATEPHINSYYDYVICDTPPELFSPTIWGLYCADYLIIPTNLEELSLAGIKILLKEIFPDVVMVSKKELKILGVCVVNITKKYSTGSIGKIEQSFIKFVKQLPSTIYNRIYKKPFFNTMIHVYNELRDLTYRPRRWEIPLGRVIDNNKELRNEVLNLAMEVKNRIERFEGII